MKVIKISDDAFSKAYAKAMHEFFEETKAKNYTPELFTMLVLMLSAFGGKLASELFLKEDKA